MPQLPIEKRMRNAPRSALVLRCAMELHQANGNWITGERLATGVLARERKRGRFPEVRKSITTTEIPEAVPYLSRFSASASVRSRCQERSGNNRSCDLLGHA